MQDFAAIDFETANFERSSVCSVGVVIVRATRVRDKKRLEKVGNLVKNSYLYR